MKYFKVRGPYSDDDNDFLYWSNDMGWVDFDSATKFEKNLLQTTNPPIEATHIVWLDKNGKIETIVNVEAAYYGE